MVVKGKHSLNLTKSMRAVLKCFIAVAFFLLSSSQFAAFAADCNSDHREQSTDLDLHNAESLNQLHPFHLPFHPDSGIPESELPENEAEEELGFDGEGEIFKHLFSRDEDLRFTGQRALPFLRSLQNRPSISLVILYHSWKTFFV